MAERIINKTCRACKQTKPISEFYKNHRSRGGYFGKCKTCHIQYVMTYRQTERGRAVYRKANRKCKQTEKGKSRKKRYRKSDKGRRAACKYASTYRKTEKGKLRRKNQRIRNLHKFQAREAVRHAVRGGKLPRADALKCSCGNQAKHYHHHNGYDKAHWLDVVPICVPCHGSTFI